MTKPKKQNKNHSLINNKKPTDKEKLTINPNGGGFLYCSEKELKAIKLQRSMLWDLAKNIGSAILEGKDLVSVSIPVYVFEPYSYLQRLPRGWCNLPLLTASTKKDPLQRLLSVIAFCIGGLHETIANAKPFNPILGETYEAVYPDGSRVYLEQTSHHPPVSHFYLVGEGFKFYGYGGYAAAIRGNALKGQHIGPLWVEYSDGTIIEFSLPYIWLSGILWGDRVCNYCGTITFTDKKHDLSCTLKFDPDRLGFISSFFSTPETPSDTVRGDVCKGEKVLGTVKGSWLKRLDFIKADTNEKQELWDYQTSEKVFPKPVDNPLPSDSRYRADLIHLAKGDLEGAAKWKHILEEKQRREKRLRLGQE